MGWFWFVDIVHGCLCEAGEECCDLNPCCVLDSGWCGVMRYSMSPPVIFDSVQKSVIGLCEEGCVESLFVFDIVMMMPCFQLCFGRSCDWRCMLLFIYHVVHDGLDAYCRCHPYRMLATCWCWVWFVSFVFQALKLQCLRLGLLPFRYLNRNNTHPVPPRHRWDCRAFGTGLACVDVKVMWLGSVV